VNDGHVLAVGRVPARSRVLDLGAADGSVAAVLKRMGCHVTAVEIDPVAAASARTVCDDVVVADLNELDFLARFGRGRFDVVLMLDVLEHLLDPAAVLARAGTVLADGGWGVISLPNIAHVSVRLALLNGNFRYTDVGLLDRTHLRFFDREGVDELLRASGWGMFELVRSMRPWGTTEIHFPDADPELVRQIESDPEGLTYQFLISAAPRTSSALSHPPLLPAAAAQAAYLEQGSELGRLRDAFAATAAERDRLEVRLAATTADGELVRSELAHLQAKGDELARLLATAAADRDAARADLESARADLESARADLERGGADRDAARADLQTARADGEAAVAARDDARAQAERLTVDLDTAQSHLSAARDEVRALGDVAAELAVIKGSHFYRVALRYRAMIDRLAPPTSRRRRLYHAAVRTLLRGGGGSQATSGDPPPICLPRSANPTVSIIIPVHDHWELTAACLRSIGDDSSAVAYEVIVVDDASADATSRSLARVEGLVAIRLDRNQGFLGAVSAGIAAAQGRYVLLLNNDTVVTRGWLGALVDTADSDPSVGVVGAKLVYPDGRLQEAGGIVWRDGSAWNYGRGAVASDPAFNTPREVDYCSGACLLIRRELLEASGGLDMAFAPGYYDDADLAFTARKLGFLVYQPRATVLHLEGASHGTDIASGVKRYQVINQRRFSEKWKVELAAQMPPDPALARVASWRAASGRALVIDHEIPKPDRDSGSVRITALMGLLTDLGYAVTFLPHNGAAWPEYAQALRDHGVEVLTGAHDLRQFLEETRITLRLAIMCRPEPAWAYLPQIRELAPDTKVVYDTVDLHFLRLQREAQLLGDGQLARRAQRLHDVETSLMRCADAAFVVSDAERDRILGESGTSPVHVIPNIHRSWGRGREFDERDGLLFVGSFPHPPNVDAARWLVQEIVPMIRRDLHDVRVSIVGSQPPEEILDLARYGVGVLGWVPDLTELYSSSRVFVAPLRYGAGMKGKVGESLAAGLPVVTTSIGAEGMELRDGEDVLVADTAEDLAKAVVRVYREPLLWSRLSTAGRASVQLRYSPDAVRSLLAGALHSLGLPDGDRASREPVREDGE
jgi:GT2 family glycosyltransferase/glycosyltransferase involved in cell wall biosynthesis/SAM-dependent methyltransferase